QGYLHPRPQPAGHMALRGSDLYSAESPVPSRSLATERGERLDEGSEIGFKSSSRIDGPVGRGVGDHSRGGRGPARRDCPPTGVVPTLLGALLLRGPDPRRGGATA